MCHISRLDWNRVEKVEDVVKLGDTLKVIVTNIDEKGRVDLSHREFLPKPEGWTEPTKSFNKSKFSDKKPFHKKEERHEKVESEEKSEEKVETPSEENN